MTADVLIRVIRSGGQSGVDRGALDAARQAGMPITGWCPCNGWAEDLPDAPGLLAAYPELMETPSPEVIQRTKWNVRDSDATLVICQGGTAASPGTFATIEFAREQGKPYLVVDPDDADRAFAWLQSLQGMRADCEHGYADETENGLDLNIAGPRESQSPGVYEKSKTLVLQLIEKSRC